MPEPLKTDGLIQSYAEFWPYYLREHSKPLTRRFHFAGTALAVLSLASFAASGRAPFLLLALLLGYGPAWVSHFFVEKNRPATFTYPLWSLVSDFRMAWAWLTGGLSRELEKAGVRGRS